MTRFKVPVTLTLDPTHYGQPNSAADAEGVAGAALAGQVDMPEVCIGDAYVDESPDNPAPEPLQTADAQLAGTYPSDDPEIVRNN